VRLWRRADNRRDGTRARIAAVKRVAFAALCALAGVGLWSCGGSTRSSSTNSARARSKSSATAPAAAAVRVARRGPSPPAYPRLQAAATATSPPRLVPAASWRGGTAAWVSRAGEVALLEFNQRVVGLRLHSGTIDAGATGWRYGPSIAGPERHL